jgi:hypothetical protein
MIGLEHGAGEVWLLMIWPGVTAGQEQSPPVKQAGFALWRRSACAALLLLPVRDV